MKVRFLPRQLWPKQNTNLAGESRTSPFLPRLGGVKRRVSWSESKPRRLARKIGVFTFESWSRSIARESDAASLCRQKMPCKNYSSTARCGLQNTKKRRWEEPSPESKRYCAAIEECALLTDEGNILPSSPILPPLRTGFCYR